ncbi:MAG: SDR family oxidoreductase [Candidatus Protochlamydia sp.]|nr:SDR family oxidoreductase [Candidatus Protochlamydia sp.]
MKKKALVAGGAGFIGSHLCERLLKEGYFVFCIDSLYTSSKNNIKHLEGNTNFVFMNYDVTQIFDLEVQEIYNLACPASPVHYQSNPLFTIQTTINGAIHLATLAQKIKAKYFQASTSEVYGEPTISPQPETYWGNVNPIGIRACYDESKRLAESILFIMHRQQPFPLKIGRIFNTYGPRMSLEDGRVISSFILQALTDQDVTLFGTGEQTRSFCYIDDLIEGILKFMNTNDDIIGPINLGNDTEFTIKETAELIINLTDSRSKIIHLPLPQDDPTQRKPDIRLALELLKWQATISLTDGIKKMLPYYKENLRPIP